MRVRRVKPENHKPIEAKVEEIEIISPASQKIVSANRSLAQQLANLPPNEKQKIMAEIPESQVQELLWDWEFWARPDQLPPDGDWINWLLLAGRGFGKTRTGAETLRRGVEDGWIRRAGLIGPTAADARDVMIEGESGILNIFPPSNRPQYQPSKRRVVFPNGAMAYIYSADEPERLRGPQHDFLWCDELCAWRYANDTWDMAMFGLRLGKKPRVVITTTPKPLKLLREIMKMDTTVITRGSTYDNLSNLPPSFAAQIVGKYEGTRLGRQELYAEVLEDVEGALWNQKIVDASRVTRQMVPELVRIVVAIDPANTSNDESDETGIIVAGKGSDGHGYVLNDISLRGSPDEWAKAAVRAFYSYLADRIVGEVNNGGEMIESTIRTVDQFVPFTAVRAARGKITRAEPISAMYEQGKIHHVGEFSNLEDQMCNYVPGFTKYSPDRMDALVWALTELMDVQPPAGASVDFGSIWDTSKWPEKDWNYEGLMKWNG